jgi:hypothetical protein
MYGGIGLVAPKRVGRYMVERIGSRDRSRGGMVGRGFGRESFANVENSMV